MLKGPRLLINLLLCALATITTAGPTCPPSGGIAQSCAWTVQPASPDAVKVVSAWPTPSGGLPVLLVSAGGKQAAAPVAGFLLTLQRLVLANVDLAAPDAAGVPKLWPLGMFAAPGTNLSLADVRLVVGDDIFQQYVSFFKSSAASWQYHTDGQSFLYITEWADKTTAAQSVTLIAGTCRPDNASAYLQPAAQAAPAAVGEGGCGVRTVDNSTIVPTLMQDGAVSTQQPLLVLVISNVTLGPGLRPGAINIRRPVIMAGLFSRITSVDLGMVVNQLNVTAPNSKMFWQSLLLENASPGDAISSIMAPPYSAAVSANVYAMYCNRTSNCLNLHNTTTVLASQEEMDYLTFMYSMFNSPLPNMRQHTDFYHTELKVTILDMGPGPNGYGMTLHNMSTSAWKLVDAVFTNQPIVRVAAKLPFPPGMPLIRQSTQAAPWVQAVDSCKSLQAATEAPSEENRLHVWMLLSNVSINPPDDPTCWQKHKLQHNTQIYGQIRRTYAEERLMTGGAQARAAKAGPAQVEAAFGLFDVYALGFGYMTSALQLPDNAHDKFIQIQNVTLLQLPQGPDAQLAVGMQAGQGGDGPAPPDVWTMLLWSINRTEQGSPVFISDVQLLLPQQEYDFVLETARGASSFVVQLAGTVGLAFTSTSIVGNAVRISSLQGPGISGTNVWLLPDPAAAQAMPGGYVWPLSVTAAPTTSRFGSGAADSQQTAMKAAVGASIGGVVLLALLAVCCLWRRRRRQRAQFAAAAAAYKPGSETSGHHSESVKRDASESGLPSSSAAGPYVCVDVGHLPDNSGILAGVNQRTTSSSSQDAGLLQAGSNSGVLTGSGESGLAPSRSAGSDTGNNTVATGLLRWKTAISTTTMQMMERRMQSVHNTTVPSSSSSSSKQSVLQLDAALNGKPISCAPNAARPAASRPLPPAAAASQASSLQLQGVLGQGSFGCVYLGIWHGKRVAVKVMQLPATALLGPEPEQLESPDDAGLSPAEQQRRRRARQQQQNSPPHMAIMETVVSSTMSHPNVVQVYTYMINPLTVEGAADAAGAEQAAEGDQQQLFAANAVHGAVSGWELKLVMEYCDQGTLREALDRRTLLRGSGASLLAPALVLSLAHDVAAALLHLHSEGVVHGDLKAANVMLTKGGEDPGGVWAATVGYRVTAKVADFGLALPLDPKDTHATMAARGTPTHMSPELFMAGHVSKASDVYAYGILLYELMTGQRAYAGVPIPLLPHEVARQGLRPTWPPNLPPGCRDLKKLAEACWAQQPQDRPCLQVVFDFLEACQNGRPLPVLSSQQQQQQQQEAQLPSHQQQEQEGPMQQAAGEPSQQGLQQEQQQQLAQPQEQQQPARAGGNKVGQGGKNMSWSEVTVVMKDQDQCPSPGAQQHT